MELTDLQQKEIEHWLTRWEIAKREPWAFLMDFACTIDEHDFTTVALNKPFPNKAYLRIVCRIWRDYEMVFVEKSRQILLTWEMCALFLWFAITHVGKKFFIQSKKDEYAQIALDRVKHIMERLMALGLPNLPQPKMIAGTIGTSKMLEFPKIKSEIHALPQGGDQMRSLTWSGGLLDESEFQPEFNASHEAYAPTHHPGNRMWSVSTVNGKGPVYHLLYDIDPFNQKPNGPRRMDSKNETSLFSPPSSLSAEEQRYWIEEQLINMSDEQFDAQPIEKLVASCPGMRCWITSSGGFSLQIHHSADPEKDPVTTKGRQWKEYMLKVFRGDKSKWAREMDMKRNVYEGRPVISNWDPDIFIQPVEFDGDYRIDLSHDFGAQVCGTSFSQYIPCPGCGEKRLRVLDELILRGLSANTPTLAKLTVERLNNDYRRAWLNGRVDSCCDPTGGRAEATTADKSLESHILILNAHNIYPNSRKFAVKQSTENMETAFWKTCKCGKPVVVISPRCKYFIECLEGGLHYPTAGKGPEGHYVKDGIYDHGGDILRYRINNDFTEFDLSDKPQPTISPVLQKYRRYTGERLGRATNRTYNRGSHAVRS